MARMLRVVPTEVWTVAESLGARRDCLLNVPSPHDLVRSVASHAMNAARNGHMELRWQLATDQNAPPGHGRLHTEFALEQETFDQLFNGRSGYRAQYYLSPEEGVLFNQDLMHALIPAVEVAFAEHPKQELLTTMLRSLAGPHSKIWIADERTAFEESPPEQLIPVRWVESYQKDNKGKKFGLRAPLPEQPMLDLKGAFINLDAGSLFVDTCKEDRACDLYLRGFT